MSKLGELEGREHGFEDGLSGKARNPRPARGALDGSPGYEAAYAAAYDFTYSRTISDRQRIIREEALRQSRSEDNQRQRQAENGREI